MRISKSSMKKLSILLTLTMIMTLFIPVASFAANPVTSVKVTVNGIDNTSARITANVGDKLTATTTVVGGDYPVCNIWVKAPGETSATWKGQTWPGSQNFTVANSAVAGAYEIDAISADSPSIASRAIVYVNSSVAITGTSFANGQLTVTAAATNLANAQYQFWKNDPVTGWSAFGNPDAQGAVGYYGTATSASFAATAGTTYGIAVYAKDINGRSVWQDAVATSQTVTATPTALTVQTVSAINLKQLQVVFNNTLDKTSAELATNYTVSNTDYLANGTAGAVTTASSASLQADGKTVLVTLTGSYANQKSKQTITVQNVKDSSGNVLASAYTNSNVSYTDVTAPSVTGVTATGPRTVEVQFSEPVTKGAIGGAGIATDVGVGNFSVDNGAIGIASATANYDKSKVVVALNADLAAGSHNIIVNSAADNTFTDFAGLPVIKATQTFTATTVSTAPTVSVKTCKPDKVTLQFSVPVKNVNSATIYHDYSNLTASGVATINLTGNQDGTYSDLWDVPFAGNYITGTSTIYIKNLVGTEIQDRYTNKMADTSVTATAVAATTPPSLTSVTATTNKVVKVKFNEDVNATDAVNPIYYTFKNSSGTTLTGTTVTDLDSYGHPGANVNLAYDANAYTTTMTFTNAIPAGSYQLAAQDIKDTATYTTNKMVAQFQSFTVVNTTAMTLQSAVKAGSTFVLTFSKAVATSGTGSALVTGNYMVNWNNDGAVALPTGSSAAIGSSNNVVVITLGDTSKFVNGTTKIAASVCDTTGAAIDSWNNNKAVSNDAGVATIGEITNVKLLAKDSFSFEVDQPLQAVNAAKVLVAANAVDSLTFVNQTLADGKTYGALVTAKITQSANYLDTFVKTAAGLDYLSVGNANKDITFNSGAFTNLQGTASTLNGGTYSTNAVNVKDYAPAYIKTITTQDTNNNGKIDQIQVVFSENVIPGSVGMSSFTVAGYTVTNVAPNALIGSYATTFNLTVTEQGTPDTGATPKVKLVQAVTDASAQANVMVAQTDATVVATTDGAVPVATLAAAGTNNGTNKLVATFSEPLYKAGTAVADGTDVKSSFTAAGGALAITSATYSASAKTITFVLAGAADTNTVTHNNDATKLTDAAGNAYPAKVYTYAAAGTVWSTN